MSLAAAHGFAKPLAIQKRAIVPILRGRDTIAQGQSGTGKTSAIAISILQKIEIEDESCQALVLVPTREQAQEVRLVM